MNVARAGLVDFPRALGALGVGKQQRSRIACVVAFRRNTVRTIRQGITSHISVHARDSASEIGVIMESTTARVTEIEATAKPMLIGDKVVTDAPPGEGYQWCSLCGWRANNRFHKNAARKSGYSNYCKDCSRKMRSLKINHV